METVCVPHCPIREQSSSTAAGDAELVFIDVAALQQLIDSGHQVLEVVTRIFVLDDVSEFLAIRSAAARIGVKNDVSLGRHPLKFMIEHPSISGMWAAVNVENQ